MSSYDLWMLIGTYVAAVCGILLTLQGMGLDIRVWGRNVVAGATTTQNVLNRPLVKYWVLLALFVLNLLATTIVWYRTAHSSPTVTTENIEETIHKWLDDFRFSVKKRDSAAAYFSFDVGLPDGFGLTIQRRKDQDKYLTLGTTMSLTPEEISMFNALPEVDRSQVIDTVDLELAHGKSDFIDHLPNGLIIDDRIPITSGLNEDVLFGAIRDVNSSIVIAQKTLQLQLRLRMKLK